MKDYCRKVILMASRNVSVDAVSVQTGYLDVDGVSYAYRELGPENPADPTPIIFLQRFRGTLDDWDPIFVDAMAARRHVVLFSDAAVGSSTGSPAKSVDEKARNAAAFIYAKGYDKVDVLGFSMGGFVAEVLAMNEPALVRNLILVGTGPGGSPENAAPDDIVFDVAMHPEYDFADNQYLFFSKGRDELTQASIDRIKERKDREPVVADETVQAMLQLILDYAGGKTGHFSELAKLDHPTLIVSGDLDPFFPVKNQWLLYREIRNSQLAIYPLAGHAPHHQHPHEITEQIEYFLTHPGRPKR
jgi:pimeloyl-ACP methyl ester carboxylesterase